MKTIYLDHAAAAPLDPSVLSAMLPYFTDRFYNPSAVYSAAQTVAKDLRDARARVAACIGARPIEITFTAGGTEANNLAISGVLRAYPGSHAIASAIEHDSVLETVKQYDHTLASVTEQGIVDIQALAGVIRDDTVLISIMYANNEIGTVQPLHDVAALADRVSSARRAQGNTLPLYLHSDAAQAGNYLDIHASRLGVDLMTLNGGKIYGPKQSGVLYVKRGVRLQPLVYGGGQEHNLRSGTENVAGAIGFAAALARAQAMKNDEIHRLQDLQGRFIARITEKIPRAAVNGSLKKRLPNNVHVTIPGTDNERLLFALDERGIQAAAGSACSAGSEESSHVLRALGLGDAAARASLRFSMGRSTGKTDIDRTVDTLAALLAS